MMIPMKYSAYLNGRVACCRGSAPQKRPFLLQAYPSLDPFPGREKVRAMHQPPLFSGGMT